MKYRIGLDIGVASVGYSVVETDEKGEPVRIEKLGVRVFEGAENPKTGASLAEPRRDARGTRRLVRRRHHRVERTQSLLIKQFGNGILKEIELEKNKDLYELRKRGIDRELSPAEIGKVLLYFVKHRGFLSNRKSETQDSKSEGGKLLHATEENRKALKERGYRTVGEMLYEDAKYSKIENGKKVYYTRNKADSYDNTFLREDLRKEIETILNRQKEAGKVNQEFIDKYISIFYTNRNYDEGPGEPSKYRGGYKVGDCPFEAGEKRSPKCAYTFEYNTALQKLNNLKIKGNGTTRELSEAEKETIKELIKKKEEIKYTTLRKTLNIGEEYIFNLINYSPKKSVEEVEKAKFISMKGSYAIRKALEEQNSANIDKLDKIAQILCMYKSDDNRINELKKVGGISEDEIERLILLNFKGFGGVSIKFLRNIQEYLERGQKYTEACESAGYKHTLQSVGEKQKKLNTQEVYESVNEITSPVVKRSITQTIKVINAIIDKYGSPMAVNIELAREMSKDLKERREITKENEERQTENEKLRQDIKNEYGVLNPNGQDILKKRLYEEQSGKSAYSGKPIDIHRLFEPNYVQIDHIIPYSRSFDDSMNNKVLVLTKENQDKKNRLPYEYIGQDEKAWQDFVVFVESTYKNNKTKKQNLLKKEFTEEDENDWKERNLNDTKYIASFMYNLIMNNLQFADDGEKNKKKVVAVNGKITSYARKLWGLLKCREDGDKHHALDATVIACITDGDIQKITRYNKNKENYVVEKGGFVDTDGVVTNVKEPYEGFSHELQYRMADNPKYYTDFFVKQGYSDKSIDELTPIFVSRMLNKKAKGVIHDATVSSAKLFEEKNLIIKKTPLSKLKLNKEKTGIEGYYNEKDDKLLYNKLLQMLKDADGKAEEAFKDKVYKPKSDGTNGAEVKKVKIYEKQTSGVLLNGGKGIASNGSMIRIDVFTKNDKYYCVPVYVQDLYKKELPNKAVVANKPCNEWIEMDNSYSFLFSLYKNDLVYISYENDFNLAKTNSNNKDDIKIIKEGFLYYNSFDANGNRAWVLNHDNSYKGRVSFGSINKIQKYAVDVLGNISLVKNETREDFSNFGNTKDKRKCRS